METELELPAHIYLPRSFVKGSGHLGLDIETRRRIKTEIIEGSRGREISRQEQYIISQLEQCIDEPCYVNLKFNRQGLPIEKSEAQYSTSDNIYFYPPIGDCCGALFSRTTLNCDVSQHSQHPTFGVLACTKDSLSD